MIPDARLKSAAGIVRGDVRTQRYTGGAIEPRGYLATYDRYRSKLTFWASTQSPHSLRLFLSEILGMRESQIQVIEPHVGGAFGLKLPTYPEEPLICYLAIKLGRPVRWIEERTENLLAGGHAREMRLRLRRAMKKMVVSPRSRLDWSPTSGAPSALCGWGMANVAAFFIPAVYKISDVRVERLTVVTNKCPWNAYRAYGKEASMLMLERMMDLVAERTGLDQRRGSVSQFYSTDEFPYKQVSGASLDSGNYQRVMAHVLQAGIGAAFRLCKPKPRNAAELIGIGWLTNSPLKAGAFRSRRSFCLRRYPRPGKLPRASDANDRRHLAGCGNETSIAQIVADELGVSRRTVSRSSRAIPICALRPGKFQFTQRDFRRFRGQTRSPGNPRQNFTCLRANARSIAGRSRTRGRQNLREGRALAVCQLRGRFGRYLS